MKRVFIIILLGLIPISNYGQSEDFPKGFGFALNSSVNGELDPFRIVPSFIYFKGKNQFEFGVGFNPTDRQNQKLLSTEINYKHYPNGFAKKYNMYLLTRISYANRSIDTYFPTNYHYLFVNGGYGLEIHPFKNAFIGTNVSLGAFTFSKKSDIPYDAFKSQKFLDEIGLNLAFQVNVGYRF